MPVNRHGDGTVSSLWFNCSFDIPANFSVLAMSTEQNEDSGPPKFSFNTYEFRLTFKAVMLLYSSFCNYLQIQS